MKTVNLKLPKKTNKKIELFCVSLAGVQYSDYQTCVGIKAGSPLTLTWEKNNKFDDMAIRVDYYGTKIGYIPKGGNQEVLHAWRDDGVKVTCSVVAYNKTNPTWHMITVKCEVSTPSNRNLGEF